MTFFKRFLLMFYTVRHLRPAQIFYRLRLRLLRRLIGRVPRASEVYLRRRHTQMSGWPLDFVPLDSRAAVGSPSFEENLVGTFSFLNETRSLGVPMEWEPADAPHLWRYHLQYFEWAWVFLHEDSERARAAFAHLWRSWQSSQVIGRGDAWAPYVASLRAWVFCGVFSSLVEGEEIESEFVEQLSVHVGYLSRNLERDVGGNHLVKNLKALIGLAVFFGDRSLLDRARVLLVKQMEIQVLGDGGHYERSPSYHAQVLSDLIDIDSLLRNADLQGSQTLQGCIARMRSWLQLMLMPDGDVPLFNDCILVGKDRLSLLGVEPVTKPGLTVLNDSGYFVARFGELHLVGDVGPPCPDELPAHAHADCLSFQLAARGERVLVDVGTSTYEPGPQRDYERSTAAHNTVMLDRENQTEVWAVFRAGRRAKPLDVTFVESEEIITVTAGHDGYLRLPGAPLHRRTWTCGRSGVQIDDVISGEGLHEIVQIFHVPASVGIELGSTGLRVGSLIIHFKGAQPDQVSLSDSKVAQRFGSVAPSKVVWRASSSRLPVTFSTHIGLDS